ncbi:MAG: DUF1802 family protein [Candidatus Omnitrophica bacterium]|nr:DUF1802 family protein [Candidatus Omnitrophota bacterium]
MTSLTRVALKEWAVVVEALGTGEQLLLFRKGGIRDPKGTFQLQHPEFLLYPTWEHQTEDSLAAIRPEFRERFKSTLAGAAHPAQIAFKIYAGTAFCAEVRSARQMEGLEKYHLWTPRFFEERLKYRPAAPTVVVVLRAYRLKAPVPHPALPEYAGCKSWVPLAEGISIEGAEPVVENRKFRDALNDINSRLQR